MGCYHNTRGGTNIRVKKYNLSICQWTFAFRGAKAWDNIPELIKNATSVECFKTMFLKHVRKDVMWTFFKLIGLHEYVECFNIACYIMYCYLTVYACVNGNMAHWKSRYKRDMVTITK